MRGGGGVGGWGGVVVENRDLLKQGGDEVGQNLEAPECQTVELKLGL